MPLSTEPSCWLQIKFNVWHLQHLQEVTNRDSSWEGAFFTRVRQALTQAVWRASFEKKHDSTQSLCRQGSLVLFDLIIANLSPSESSWQLGPVHLCAACFEDTWQQYFLSKRRCKQWLWNDPLHQHHCRQERENSGSFCRNIINECVWNGAVAMRHNSSGLLEDIRLNQHLWPPLLPASVGKSTGRTVHTTG